MKQPQVVTDLLALIEDAKRCTRIIDGYVFSVGRSIESDHNKNKWCIWSNRKSPYPTTHFVYRSKFYKTKSNALRALALIK